MVNEVSETPGVALQGPRGVRAFQVGLERWVGSRRQQGKVCTQVMTQTGAEDNGGAVRARLRSRRQRLGQGRICERTRKERKSKGKAGAACRRASKALMKLFTLQAVQIFT